MLNRARMHLRDCLEMNWFKTSYKLTPSLINMTLKPKKARQESLH